TSPLTGQQGKDATRNDALQTAPMEENSAVKTNDAPTILPCWPLFTRTRKAGNMPFSYLIGKSLLWLWNCLDSYPYETTENSTYSFLCCLPSALNERLCGGRLDSLGVGAGVASGTS